MLDELRPEPAPPPVVEPRLPPQPAAEPPPTPAPVPETPAQPVVESPTPPPVTPPVEDHLRVAALLTSRLPDYERVVDALRADLGDLDVFDLSDKSLTQREIADAMQAAQVEVVIAIGYRAALVAAALDELPVVFAQVFNTGALADDSPRIRGVAALPPLDRQLAEWRALNPSLSSVGMIVGAGHESLIEEGRLAAENADVRFHHRVAQSDRETLYQFNRLVPDIDGYWLVPDNRVLSADVLRQMLAIARRHGVQVAAFNDSLLSIGATLSSTPVSEDLASTILAVAARLAEDDGAELPYLSPLSEVDTRTAADVAALAAGTGGSR